MPKTVLIVEDEYLIAMDLQLMLEGDGWIVLGPVSSVRDALRLLEDKLPTAALLDVNLGHELVTPVAEYLAEHNVPFAVATAYSNAEQFGGGVFTGVPNVGKPTSERRLLSVLGQLTNA